MSKNLSFMHGFNRFLLLIMAICITHIAQAQDFASLASASKKSDGGRQNSEPNASMPLERFMQKVQSAYNIYFSYETDALKNVVVSYSVSAEKNQTDPDVLLKKVLFPAGLSYDKVNEVYIIKKAPAKKSIAVAQEALPPGFPVKGHVADNNGPLVGVTVTEKDHATITRTDINGNFELNVSGPEAILVFSSVGYKTLEMAVDGRHEITVHLSTGNAEELSGVVVTALGITRAKKSLGYSVGEIKGEDVNKVAQTNVLNAMAGKVSGVTISSTGGTPTSSVSVVIRGIRSLNSDNQPLFIVDGVPVKNSMSNIQTNNGKDNEVDYGNAMSDINPNDIASISILKGPSAAALYGSRAGNGVVLITTKSGKKARGLGITFSTSEEFDKPYKFLPTNQSYTVGTDPYTEINDYNSWNGQLVDMAGTDTYRFGTPLNIGLKAIQWNSKLNDDGTYELKDMVSHNNLKNFVKTGLTAVNSISIENASDKDNYRLSYTNTKNNGIVPTTGLLRHNLGLNVEHKVSDAFKISSSLNYTRASTDNVVAGNNGGIFKDVAYLSPSVDVRDMKNYWLTPGIQQRKVLPPVGVESDPDPLDPASDGDNNPWFTLNQVKNGFLRNRFFGNVKADFQLSKHFSAFVRYSQDILDEMRESKISKSYNSEKKGYYGLTKIYSAESNTDALVTYHNDFKAFDFSASVGGNHQYVNGNSLQVFSKPGAGITAPEFFNVNNIAGDKGTASNFYQKAVNSVYATASLGFQDMAFLDLTGRNDWSSTLPENNYSYFYPSASLSLLLNRMLHIGGAVDLIKVRGGWARVGKDTDPYNLYGPLGLNSDYSSSVVVETTSGTLKNPNLKPEQATSTEFGLDLAFFQNRLRFEGTVYQSDNKNQVLGIATAPSTGYSSSQVNAGLVRSKGIELVIGGTIVRNKDWNWDLSINYTKNSSYIISLVDGSPYFKFWDDGNSGAWTYAKGQAIPNQFHADGTPVISDGKLGQLWDNQIATVEDKSSPYYGYPLLDNDGQYQKLGGGDFNHKEVVGNYNPKLLMGMQTSVSWKMFTLSASVDMRLGGTFFSQTYRYLQSDAAMARQENMGIPIPEANKSDIPAFLKSNPDKYIKFHGLEQFKLVGGPTTETGGFPYQTNGGITINDGAFFPGVYDDGNGGYIENLGDMNLTKLDNYEDAATAGWSFARMSMFDASYIKLRELTLSTELPRKFVNSLKLQGISFGIYTRNVILWTKAKAGVDPEAAFQFQTGNQGNNSQFRQGIERYNITPWTIPMGVKLGVRF